jgi:hypothetical protein
LVFATAVSKLGWGSARDDAGSPLYRDLGFDLDDTCTDEGQGASCGEPSWANKPHTDGTEGIDNAFGQMASSGGLDVLSISDAGATDMLLRIQDYSGTPNDEQVTLTLYYAYGTAPRDSGTRELLWDGQDPWTIARNVLVTPADGAAPSIDQPLFVDRHAYVSDWVLVSRLDDAVISSGPGSAAPTLLVPVRGMVLQGTLRQVRPFGSWELDDGVVGARMSITSALRLAFYALAYPGMPFPACSDPNAIPTTIRQTCGFADIAYEGDSPQAPCDALSLGFGFQAKQALLSDVIVSPAALPLCDMTVDSHNPSCDSPGAN